MHYVLIVGSYYPSFSAVGKCMGNIANELSKSNKVTVICEKTSVLQSDNEQYNNQELVRVSTPFRLKVLRETADKERSRMVQNIRHNLRRAQRVKKRILSHSSVDKQLVQAYERALDTIGDTIDVIIPTCSPFDSVVAALNYKRKQKEVMICPCLFDLFAENNNLNLNALNKRIKYAANVSFEKRMFEKSNTVFHVENWSNHIARVFPMYLYKCRCIEHPLLIDSVIENQRKTETERIHAVYMGVVDTKIRNPEKALKIINDIDDSNIEFDFYAYGSAQNIIEKYAKDNEQIMFCGKVDTEVADEKRRDADILVSIGNSDYSQIPSKLIEYIATGKPILHFANDINDPAVNMLYKYKNSLIIDVSENTDVDEIRAFILSNVGRVVGFSEIARTFKTADPRFIAREIANQILNNRGGTN